MDKAKRPVDECDGRRERSHIRTIVDVVKCGIDSTAVQHQRYANEAKRFVERLTFHEHRRRPFLHVENVEMSLFGADFISNLGSYLSCDENEDPDVQFCRGGYLFLATDKGMDVLRENHRVQTDVGADVDLMTPKQLKESMPWLNVDGLAGASYGASNEGWFDPWSLLSCFRKKASSLGVEYVHGTVRDVVSDNGNARCVCVEHDDGRSLAINCGIVVNAAGPLAGHVHEMVCANEPIELPVRPRKRNVYVLHCPDGPGQSCPMVIDPSGFYVRREGNGGHYLCGKSPRAEDDPDVTLNHLDDVNARTFDVDHDFFENEIWEDLATRIPAFEQLKVVNSWYVQRTHSRRITACVTNASFSKRTGVECTNITRSIKTQSSGLILT